MEVSLACPSCGGPVALGEASGQAVCTACDWSTALAGHLCPTCDTFYRAETAVCAHCGEATTHLCSSCGCRNWSGSEACRQCGTILDILESLPQYTLQGYRDRLRKQASHSTQLKDLEEAGSRQRMERMLKLEEERQAKLALRSKRQQERERRKVFIVLAAAFVILVVAFVLILLT